MSYEPLPRRQPRASESLNASRQRLLALEYMNAPRPPPPTYSRARPQRSYELGSRASATGLVQSQRSNYNALPRTRTPTPIERTPTPAEIAAAWKAYRPNSRSQPELSSPAPGLRSSWPTPSTQDYAGQRSSPIAKRHRAS